MISNVISFGISGLDGYKVSVETDISRGIPVFEIVGMGDISVREARERVKTAIKNQGFDFPLGRIIINLAPADKRKAGSALDLSIAVGILSANTIIAPSILKDIGFIGELSLDGHIRKVNGVLPMAVWASKNGIRRLVVPQDNYGEVIAVQGIELMAAANLRQVVDYVLAGEEEMNRRSVALKTEWNELNDFRCVDNDKTYFDFIDVSGQEQVKRALEISAAGAHNLLMMGAAGIGKTMMAKRVPGLLPEMDFDEAFEVASIYSVAGLLDTKKPLQFKRPFRAVHSGITQTALVGGGRPVKPGEISLAHKGILFIDEICELKKGVLDSLRQPLEEGTISVVRLGAREVYPSDFILIGASNPCKCGKLYEEGKCTCTPKEIQRYLSGISRPILDRIDIQIPVRTVKYQQLANRGKENSGSMRERVSAARRLQKERYAGYDVQTNGRMNKHMMDQFCIIDKPSKVLLEQSIDLYGFSVRAYEMIIKVARTIADLALETNIKIEHIAEAVQYRWFDMNYGKGWEYGI